MECLKSGVGKDSIQFLTTRHLNVEIRLTGIKQVNREVLGFFFNQGNALRN